jgi:hypothetical protein
MNEKSSGEELAVEQDVRPCKHMEGMVNGLADGTLHGPAKWYTEFHAMHCTQCRAAVSNLRIVIGKVKDLRDDGTANVERMPADRREELERALDEVDNMPRNKA